jgi:hypothetical protein
MVAEAGFRPVVDFAARIEAIQKKIQKKAHAGTAEQAVQAPSAEVRLPVWPESVRAVPNGILRSALFGVVGKGRRSYINGEDLTAVDGVTIRFKGEQLDQGDLDVYLGVLHLLRGQVMGCKCRVTAYSLLRLLGRTDSGKNRTILHERIERLVANAVTVRQGKHVYIGSLIAWAAKDEGTHEWVIEIDPNLSRLFQCDQFSQLEWVIRRALAGQPLAQWLHGFFSSHAQPLPYHIDTLLALAGSSNAVMGSGRQKLKKALAVLAAASEAHGQHFGFVVRNSLVYVTRKQSRAQARHLLRKAFERN